MKLFAILFVTIAVANMVAAGHHSSSLSDSQCSGLAGLLGPVLKLLQPLLNGVNKGVQAGAGQVACGVNDLGKTLQSTCNGLGSITANTLTGAAGTAKALPSTLYKTTQKLQTNFGIVGNLLSALTGACNKHKH